MSLTRYVHGVWCLQISTAHSSIIESFPHIFTEHRTLVVELRTAVGTTHNVWCVANLEPRLDRTIFRVQEKVRYGDRLSTGHGRRLAVLMFNLPNFEAVEFSYESTHDADLRECVQISRSSSRHRSSSHDVEQFGKKTTGQPWRKIHWNVSTP